MRINYNATGTQRKELATAIGITLEVKLKYLRMPSAAYENDCFTVIKDGALGFNDRVDSEEIETVLEAIAAAGLEPEPQEAEENEAGRTAAEDAEITENAHRAKQSSSRSRSRLTRSRSEN